jgi:drug/metabolite transporter (DMT)-like permease
MKIRIWSALISVYIVWGSTYLAIRFAVETIPPFWMAGIRFLVAGAILYTWRRLAKDPAPTRLEWRSAAIIGIFLLVGGNGGVTWAEQRVASGIAALMVGSSPLWMVLLDAIRPGGKRPNWQTMAGVFVGFVGIVLLIGPFEMKGSSGKMDLWGIIALVLSAFFWAIGSLYSRGAKLPASPLTGTSMEMLVGGGVLLLLSGLSGEWGRLNLSAIAPRSIWALVYLIILGSLVGFVAYTWLLRVAPTPLVSTYAYVNPLIAIFLGNLLAQETLTLRTVIAALIIVSAVALINTANAPRGETTPKPVVTTPAGDD